MSKISFESVDGIKIELEVDNRITFLGGNSGTGRSFLMKVLKDSQENPESIMKCDVDPQRFVFILNDEDMNETEEIADSSIVFVDRYDSF